MLPGTLEVAATSEFARVFGTDFAEALAALPVGSWQGPVRSGFRPHLVQVTERLEGRKATLQEVRDEVERDLMHRAPGSRRRLLQRLRSTYVVRVDAATDVAEDPAG